MTTNKRNTRKGFVVLGAAVVLGTLSIAAWSSISHSNSQRSLAVVPADLDERQAEWERRKEHITAENLILDNKTKGLTVVSRERVDDTIRLKLKNEYTKTITAYEVAVADMTI